MFDLQKCLEDIGTDIEKLGGVIATIVADPSLDPGVRQYFEVSQGALLKSFQIVMDTLPGADARLKAELADVRTKTTQAREQIDALRERIRTQQMEAGKPESAAPPPAYDMARGRLIKEQLLLRFGPRAEMHRPHEAEAGDVVEMGSGDFAQSSSQHIVPVAPPTVPVPAPTPPSATRPSADIAQMQSGDFSAEPTPNPKAPKPRSKKSTRKIEGLPEDLWKD